MAAVAFDTLKRARSLRTDAQMSAEQAEGVSNALAEAMSGAELATKADIALLRADLAASEAAIKAELKAEIKSTIAETKAEIAETKADILRWMFGALVAQIAVLAGLIKLIH